MKIDIIKHPNEIDGKSTAVHAKLLAPDDVTIYKYPCIPEYEEKRHEVRDSLEIARLYAGEVQLPAAVVVPCREEATVPIVQSILCSLKD